MATRKKGRGVDWTRWLHDPQHWARFYDELATHTFAAISKEICAGKWPDEAADLAIEDVTRRMRRDDVPERIVALYREEYLKHRPQLIEIAQELTDIMPPEANCQVARQQVVTRSGPFLLPLWLAEQYWHTLARCMQGLLALTPPPEERRHPEKIPEGAELVKQTGRRRRDLNVERL